MYVHLLGVLNLNWLDCPWKQESTHITLVLFFFVLFLFLLETIYQRQEGFQVEGGFQLYSSVEGDHVQLYSTVEGDHVQLYSTVRG